MDSYAYPKKSDSFKLPIMNKHMVSQLKTKLYYEKGPELTRILLNDTTVSDKDNGKPFKTMGFTLRTIKCTSVKFRVMKLCRLKVF